MPTIVALGEMLIDFAPVAADAAGYPTLKAQPGGAPCNFLAALQKYGCSTAMIGKAGDDRFGRLLIQTAADCGIETRGIIKDAAAFTTMAFVTLEDVAGSVEVIVFPRDYEKNADKIMEDEKVFIKGRVSAEEDKDAKLICEQITAFSEIPKPPGRYPPA